MGKDRAEGRRERSVKPGWGQFDWVTALGTLEKLGGGWAFI